MVIRHALPSDSAALIALTSLTPMKGPISLRIDRKPDFFSLLKQRGDAIVLVAEDKAQIIIGSFSAAKQYFLLNGSTVSVYYLGDLKVHPAYAKSFLAFKLVREMHRELLLAGADLLICTAAEGNEAVLPFFNGRAGIPPFRKINTFDVFQLLPKKGPIDDSLSTSGENIQSFFRQFYQRFHFYPCIQQCQTEEVLAIRQDEEVLAAISLFDPSAHKQNVLVDYTFPLHLTLGLLRGLQKLFPLPPLPVKGESLRLLYVKQFGFLPKGKTAFLQLLQQARARAYRKQYHFLTMAVDERDVELRNLIKPLSRFAFRSTCLGTSLSGNENLLNEVCSGIAYEDYSLV
jgi:hypothetical protein